MVAAVLASTPAPVLGQRAQRVISRSAAAAPGILSAPRRRPPVDRRRGPDPRGRGRGLRRAVAVETEVQPLVSDELGIRFWGPSRPPRYLRFLAGHRLGEQALAVPNPRIKSPLLRSWSHSVEDTSDLAAVEVEFAGDGALAVACLVAHADSLLQRWRNRQLQWCFVRQRRRSLVSQPALSGTCLSAASCADEHHQQLERTNQRQRGPGADQGADRAMSRPVRQVGADRGADPGARAPGGQPWYRLAPSAGVQYHHGGRPDQPARRTPRS